MGRLIFLAALVLLVLAVYFAARASRARRISQEINRGWYPVAIDLFDQTLVRIDHYDRRPYVIAQLNRRDPDYDNQKIEAWGQAVVKAEDWNSTDKALTQ